MKKLSYLMILAAAVCLTGCISIVASKGDKKHKIFASSTYVSKELSNVSFFEAIKVNSIVDVEYTISDDGKTRVTLHGSDNVIDYIKAEVLGNTLYVGIMEKNFVITGNAKLKVTASGPRLYSVETSSTGSINIHSDIETGNDFHAVSTSTGRINLQGVECRGLRLRTESTGSIMASHVECIDAVCKVSSTGGINIKSVECRNAELRTSSTGSIKIGTVDAAEITAESSSTGSVRISGTADKAHYSVSSTGSIHAEELAAIHVKAFSSSTGSVYCFATESIEANTSSVGKVVYEGNPHQVNIKGDKVRKK